VQTHRIFLVPGMFGFGRLAGFDYFQHVRRALHARFDAAGVPCVTELVATPPTSSLRHRARILARAVEKSPEDGPVHLLGHSTGGLDLRLVLSPACNLDIDRNRLRWTERVTAAVTINTPHFGTPLASYFSTVSGTRMLYALSVLTVVTLSVGEPGFSMFSKVVKGLGHIERLVAGDLGVIGPVADLVLRFVDDGGRADIQEFLSKVRIDQGGVVQLMPEAMDLFNASTVDAPHVRYGCVATAAPPPSSLRIARRLFSPYALFSGAIYSTLYQFTAKRPPMYPYARPDGQQHELLTSCLPGQVTDRTSDGVVPTLSMLWGRLLWCGEADHLDVLGHFHDEVAPSVHTDWATSGASFNRKRFAEVMDAVARFLLDRS
jgi:hypothetical protein